MHHTMWRALGPGLLTRALGSTLSPSWTPTTCDAGNRFGIEISGAARAELSLISLIAILEHIQLEGSNHPLSVNTAVTSWWQPYQFDTNTSISTLPDGRRGVLPHDAGGHGAAGTRPPPR
ncbi:hypothetical protein VTI74DRAFT_9140 [Chaetomium olivicolor]